MSKPLTISMAAYDDFPGVWATVTSLHAHHPESKSCEIMVVANKNCEATRGFCVNAGVRYEVQDAVTGTAYPRDRIFSLASCDFVLVVDSHVMLAPGSVARLMKMAEALPESRDLFQGPMVHDGGGGVFTHMSPRWQDNMFGVFASDPRGDSPDSPPFEVPMMGLGLFACNKSAWPGFNRKMKGFGGEEGYIHAKFKKRGGTTWCLPWLRWWHRTRPRGSRPEYPNVLEDRVYNYFVGFIELNLSLAPIREHFGASISSVVMKRIEERAAAK